MARRDYFYDSEAPSGLATAQAERCFGLSEGATDVFEVTPTLSAAKVRLGEVRPPALDVKTRFDVMTIRGWRAGRDQDPQ